MQILLSNDDGYDAVGLQVLHDAISQIADTIVVAPEENRSGCSSALSLRKPIRAQKRQNGFISVSGTPADCVHLAITGMLDELPDMVISGINNGPNFGDDVVYSGTVAAIIESRFLKLPGIAVSLAGDKLENFVTAAQVSVDLVKRLKKKTLPKDCMLNVNVPDLPYGQLKGFEVTRLGKRNQSQPIIELDRNENGGSYQIGQPGDVADDGDGTDFHAVRTNKVSVTPITIDMTDYSRIREVNQWID